ncbi:MAG: lysophospholipid acyltransferase family protein [Wenzhouxiangellaceae bacterium]|nr:lysophospholipid acyltransferase family protein [Wenzhouxiangellaceae bacterium]
MKPIWLKRFLRRLFAQFMNHYVRLRGRGGLAAIQRDGDRLGRLHYHLAIFSRRKLKQQVARLFNARSEDPKIAALLKQAWRINDRMVLEVLAKACAAVSIDEVADSVSVTDAEELAEALESGQGAILLGMHSGNVLALLIKLTRRGLPISVIANQPRRLPANFFEDFFAGSSVEVIPARPEFAAFYKLNKAVKQGRAVFIPIDQIHKRGGIEARFLDKRVPMPGGASVLAKRHGVPVYPVLLEAVEPKWQFRIGKGIHLPADQAKHQDMADLVAIIEDHIRRRPELWSWHHRRWMRFPFESTRP